MTLLPPPPQTIDELILRAQSISGKTIDQLSNELELTVPDNLLRDKGWIGQLLEKHLGATAGTKAEPDFEFLGIELKTLPINALGKPLESTFVCTISLLNIGSEQWENSELRKKLAQVLWVPIVVDENKTIGERLVASPLLWTLEGALEEVIKQDWIELTDMISMGELESITAKNGRYLQVRPKGADAKSLCWGLDQDGHRIQTLPRGFYLRTIFTESLLKEYFAVAV